MQTTAYAVTALPLYKPTCSALCAAEGPTKELHIVLHGLPIQRVQHGVPCTISGGRASVGLPAPPKV